MSIFLDRSSRVVVQGITGRMAQFHTKEMLDYGTNVVAGVVPGKGGETVMGIPVFNTMKEAVAATSCCRKAVAGADSAIRLATRPIETTRLILHPPALGRENRAHAMGLASGAFAIYDRYRAKGYAPARSSPCRGRRL